MLLLLLFLWLSSLWLLFVVRDALFVTDERALRVFHVLRCTVVLSVVVCGMDAMSFLVEVIGGIEDRLLRMARMETSVQRRRGAGTTADGGIGTAAAAAMRARGRGCRGMLLPGGILLVCGQ